MLTLVNGPCSITLAPDRGAIVTSLMVDGTEALYLDQATFDNQEKNVRGGVPVLFPICGPLQQPRYQWAGRDYALNQHGFARNLPWLVIEQNSESVLLELSDNPATREQFPWSFCYHLKYVALNDGLRIEQTITNRSQDVMPFQFGFHPYFLVGEKSCLQFELPITSFRDNKSETTGTFLGFDFSSAEIDWLFPSPTAPQASLIDPMRGLRFTVSFGPAYQALVFWTLKGAPFVCLEPWSSSRLAFPQGPDVHHLESGQRLQTEVTLTVTKAHPGLTR